MALPLSGAISFEDIALELYGDKNKAISLDSTLTRLLAGKSSGSISLSDLYGQVGKMSYSVDDYVLTNGPTKDVSVTLTTNGRIPITGKFSGVLTKGSLKSKSGSMTVVRVNPSNYADVYQCPEIYAVGAILPNSLVSSLFVETLGETYQYKVVQIFSTHVHLVAQFVYKNGAFVQSQAPKINYTEIPSATAFSIGSFYTRDQIMAVTNDSTFAQRATTLEVAGANNYWRVFKKGLLGGRVNAGYTHYTFHLYTYSEVQYYPYEGIVYLKSL